MYVKIIIYVHRPLVGKQLILVNQIWSRPHLPRAGFQQTQTLTGNWYRSWTAYATRPPVTKCTSTFLLFSCLFDIHCKGLVYQSHIMLSKMLPIKHLFEIKRCPGYAWNQHHCVLYCLQSSVWLSMAHIFFSIVSVVIHKNINHD